MKNIKILLLILPLLLTSCFGGGNKYYGTMDDWDTVVIDGCEYMYSPNYGFRSIVHKGNCSNPIHIYNEKG